MKKRKGIILAGGSGTRLHPITLSSSKQLLPIYDKPMIYYPLSILMLTKIREVCIITTPQCEAQYKSLLGNGSQWGMSFSYIQQVSPDGLAQAYTLAETFLNGSPSAMVLGDNIFYGSGLVKILENANNKKNGGTVFGYEVTDPSQYGVLNFDDNGNVISIIEKPVDSKSNLAVTGLYFLDETASERAKAIKPSARGELEITSLLETYHVENTLSVEKLSRGFSWLDTGTHENLLDAANLVKTIQKRQGLQISCPEEIAYKNNWITRNEVLIAANRFNKTNYGKYLLELTKKN
jgi:glucose-1-phosphate thymidylyltransferase